MTFSDNPTASPQSTSHPENFLGSTRRLRRSMFDLDQADLLPALVLLAGLSARLFEAWTHFLNPDEALHFLLASQPSVGLAYKAALTNAHPPLLILVLHYWRALGHSELMLRMPSVLAGTACCWITYQ